MRRVAQPGLSDNGWFDRAIRHGLGAIYRCNVVGTTTRGGPNRSACKPVKFVAWSDSRPLLRRVQSLSRRIGLGAEIVGLELVENGSAKRLTVDGHRGATGRQM
jgi:hypothetical protein